MEIHKYFILLLTSIFVLFSCLTSCDTQTDILSDSLTTQKSFLEQIFNDDDDETDAPEEIIYESCENVYELQRLEYPSGMDAMIATGDTGTPFFNIDQRDAMYSIQDTMYVHLDRNDSLYWACYDTNGSLLDLTQYGDVYQKDSVYFHAYQVLRMRSDRYITYNRRNHAGASELVFNLFCRDENENVLWELTDTIGISFLTPLDDQYFVFGHTDKFCICDLDGNVVGPFDTTCYIKSGYRRSDGTYLLIRQDNQGLLYDPQTQSVTHTDVFSPTTLAYSANKMLFTEDAVYLVVADGIYVQRNGEETLLCDFSVSFLDKNQLNISAALSGDRFFVWYQDIFTGESYPAILHPTEDTQRPAKKIIRLASIGNNRYSGTNAFGILDLSVTYFNRNSEDYRIAVTDFDLEANKRYNMANMSNEAFHEVRDNLFNDALLHDGPFDLYLFGPSYEQRDMLLDKGMFYDLTALADKHDLISCVRAALTQNGRIDAIPFSVILSTLVTTTDTLSAETPFTYDTLYAIRDALAEGQALFCNYSVYQNMYDIALYDYVDFENKTCSYDSEEFVRFLQFMTEYLSAIDRRGGSYQDIPSSQFYSKDYGNMAWSGGHAQFFGDIMRAFAEGDVKFWEITIDNPKAIQPLYAVFRELGVDYNLCGYPSAAGGSLHMETELYMSVGRNSEVLDGALDYISIMLSDLIQTSQAMTQFPVTRSAVEAALGWGHHYYYAEYSPYLANQKDEIPWYVSISEVSSFALPDNQASQFDRHHNILKPEVDKILSYLCDSEMRGAGDTVIRSMIEEELSFTANGARSIADAAKIIQSRVFIYINE